MSWHGKPGLGLKLSPEQSKLILFHQDKVHCQEKKMVIIDGTPLNLHGKVSFGCAEASNLGP